MDLKETGMRSSLRREVGPSRSTRLRFERRSDTNGLIDFKRGSPKSSGKSCFGWRVPQTLIVADSADCSAIAAARSNLRRRMGATEYSPSWTELWSKAACDSGRER